MKIIAIGLLWQLHLVITPQTGAQFNALYFSINRDWQSIYGQSISCRLIPRFASGHRHFSNNSNSNDSPETKHSGISRCYVLVSLYLIYRSFNFRSLWRGDAEPSNIDSVAENTSTGYLSGYFLAALRHVSV